MTTWLCTAAIAAGVTLSVAARADDGAGYTLWPAPSLQKVFRTDQPPAEPGPARVSAAANEVESVQVVITAGAVALEDVRVSVDLAEADFAGEAPEVTAALFLPHYVPCPAAGHDFPDPLPPLPEAFRVEANTSQPVWIEVSVGKGAKTGLHTGKVRVEPANAPARSLPLKVEVYAFELPDGPLPVTTFGVSNEFIWQQHGVAADTPEAQRLTTAYYEFLLQHKVSAYNLPVDLRSDEAAQYLNDPRLTSFVIPWREDEQYLRDTAAFLREHGWLDKGYLYVVDEPISRDSYDQIKRVAELAHRADPGLRLVSPFYRAPDWDDSLTPFDVLTGYLDIWCPNEQFFDLNPRIYEQFRERQAAGQTGWWYVCCGPGEPYNNFFVQMDGCAHRLIFTQMWRLGVSGLLYWSTTYWNPDSTVGTSDPWTDMSARSACSSSATASRTGSTCTCWPSAAGRRPPTVLRAPSADR